MNRRTLLRRTGIALGTLGAVGAGGRYTLLPPSRSRRLATVDELSRELFEQLSPETRESACVDYDHPLRQAHNRGVWIGGQRIWLNFSWDERQLLVDLFHAGLSELGRTRVHEQRFVRWPGIHLLDVLFLGDPSQPPYQLVFSGPHLNLRIGGRGREGVAFGGAQVYGDQRGNGRFGLPGNRYRYQLEIATRLFESLDAPALKLATIEMQPVQTQIEYRGSAGAFPGVPLSGTRPATRRIARELVQAILENYPDEEVDYALACLEANGGVGGLSLSHYEIGEDGRSGPFQIFRLEGPAAVFHFRGHPHVHAFMNVGMNGDAPLSVGELLGVNPAQLEGAAVRALFEAALRESTGTEVAYYDPDSVVGRLRTGPIRTGDIYNLESWRDRIVVLEIDGSGLRTALIEALEQRGISPDKKKSVTVATTAQVAKALAGERLGPVLASRPGSALRDATIDYLKRNGFAREGS